MHGAELTQPDIASLVTPLCCAKRGKEKEKPSASSFSVAESQNKKGFPCASPLYEVGGVVERSNDQGE